MKLTNSTVFYSNRGVLSSTFTFANVFGVLLGCTIGSLFKVYATLLVGIILVIIFGVSIVFLPETPLFLLKQNKIFVSIIFLEMSR